MARRFALSSAGQNVIFWTTAPARAVMPKALGGLIGINVCNYQESIDPVFCSVFHDLPDAANMYF
ncbi:MAG: hypothetical protein ACOCM4_05470 [Acetivibrio ethanolgignens]